MLCDNTLQLIFKDIFSLIPSSILFWCSEEPLLFNFFCGGLLVSALVHLLCSWFMVEFHPHYHSKVIHLRSLYDLRCIFQDKSTNHCFPPMSSSPNRRSVGASPIETTLKQMFNHASQSPDEQAGESPDKPQTDAHMLHKMHAGELARSSSRQRRDYITISTC